ncbi:hypothetical protein ACOBQB_31750 [Streptomyces sp. G5(2025)]|uniref:hypothetical protein n=1 Tax=Streptomyces sp. G5(2025) TaxID=3406628 RepID=UPI003C26FAAF
MLWGGVLIACGHYAMAVPTAAMTWVGLGLVSAGTGLLKPDLAPQAFASQTMGGLAVLAGIAVIALAPWLRRTMHPVH